MLVVDKRPVPIPLGVWIPAPGCLVIATLGLSFQIYEKWVKRLRCGEDGGKVVLAKSRAGLWWALQAALPPPTPQGTESF